MSLAWLRKNLGLGESDWQEGRRILGSAMVEVANLTVKDR